MRRANIQPKIKFFFLVLRKLDEKNKYIKNKKNVMKTLTYLKGQKNDAYFLIVESLDHAIKTLINHHHYIKYIWSFYTHI